MAEAPVNRQVDDVSFYHLARSLSGAGNLEELTRPILALLQRVTGLESTYLTLVDLDGESQQILYAENSGDLDMPEGIEVSWHDTLCRRALNEGQCFSSDVPRDWPDSPVAEFLGIQSYLSVPVNSVDGKMWGTLCGASSQKVEVDPDTRYVLDLCSYLIAYQLEREIRARAEVERARKAENRLEALSLMSSIGDVCFRSADLESALISSADILAGQGDWSHAIPFVFNGPAPKILARDQGGLEALTREADRRLPLAYQSDENIHPDPVFRNLSEDDAVYKAWQESGLPMDGQLALLSVETGRERVAGILLVYREAPDEPENATSILINCSNYLSLLAERTDYLTQLERANQELAIHALHDPLTGLANRRYLVEELGRRLAQGRRDGSRVFVVFIDLDGFKKINDDHGHETGDQFLKEVAHRLNDVCRSGDLASRYGGDEFVVISDAKPADCHQGALQRFVVRLAQALTGEFNLPEVSLDYPGASVGAVISTLEERDPDALLQRADRAMYLQKNERRKKQG